MVELNRRTLIGGALAGVAGSVLLPDIASAGDDFNWRDFIGSSDLLWKKMPTTWYEGPYLGNGFLGSGIYAEPNANAIRFNVQHSQVQDHRPEFGALFGLARLPIGYFTLEPVGAITGVDLRMDLWNAELTGTITTAAGSLRIRAFIHTKRDLYAIDVQASEDERAFKWVFHPLKAISPRVDPKWNRPAPAGFTDNPPVQLTSSGDVQLAVQPLNAGGEHVTAWREVTRGTRRTLFTSVAWSHPAKTAVRRAIGNVRCGSIEGLAVDHRLWWHDFYRKSFLSIPDKRLQAFYWIQLYKFASAARKEAPAIATCGPWLENTPWPNTWWNLNVQLEYWLIHGSNHVDFDAVTYSVDRYRDVLVEQVPAEYRHDSAGIPRTTDTVLNNGAGIGNSGYGVGIPGKDVPTPEVGNLTWTLHNVWLTYRHTMDDRVLRNVLFPLLRRAINYYFHFLTKGSDGKWHLPITFSPEYGVNAPDTNYDLALIRWGCRTLIESAKSLRVNDPLIPKWQDTLANLTPYPVDANGYMIGAGVPFAKSHRHYSHMLQIYPLYEVTWEDPAQRQVIETSLNHWISFEGALQGYTFTGAASISAQMLRGDKADFYLGELMRRYIKPNTMYQESGPVIETPLSAVQSMYDMLCQSWGGVIRVFPAVPWPEISLDNFRTQGAFLLSASRQKGATRWIKIRSEAGAPCVVRTDIKDPVVRDRWGRPKRFSVLPNGDLRIELRRGEEAVIHRSGDKPELKVGPVIGAPAPSWGLPG
ncbi:Tat pathway signal sequence domain protein [Lentzea sp. NPDC005914]|uniref:glycosyl hydrolase family 95 catalytic domain-containing protein n=1 Tax=Lentzea sp. NPDC005914 TaxID=3154572 RepID=UPI003404A638